MPLERNAFHQTACVSLYVLFLLIENSSSKRPPWRNWLARLTVNQEVESSSLSGGVSYFCTAQFITFVGLDDRPGSSCSVFRAGVIFSLVLVSTPWAGSAISVNLVELTMHGRVSTE